MQKQKHVLDCNKTVLKKKRIRRVFHDVIEDMVRNAGKMAHHVSSE